jgi:VWFA-related protein
MLFFDLYFTSAKSLKLAEKAARDLVENGLHPTDLVGVGFFSDARGVMVPLAFTSDRGQVMAVLDELHALLERDTKGSDGKLGLSPRDLIAIAGRIGTGVGEKSNTAMDLMMEDYWTEDIVHMAREMVRTNREVGRGEVDMLTRGLTALARAFADVDGRKHLVFFSEGFSDSFLRGERSLRNMGRQAGGDAGVADVGGYGDLDRMADAFRRGGWVIDTVEAFGLSGNWDPTGIGSEGLSYMARTTGGTFFTQTNDLSEAMGRMLETSTVTYVLTFDVPDAKFDGSYHKLAVKLRGGPSGAQVVHRAGYYAPKPPDKEQVARRAKAIELLLGPERSDLQTVALATPFRSADGRGAYVPVVVEVDPGSLAAELRGATTALEFYGYAFDPSGEVADYFTQVVRFETARYGDTVRAGGLRFVADLKLDPGRYDLRLLVRSAGSGRAAVRVLPLEVPAFDMLPARLLPPFFVQPDRAGLTVRETAANPDAQARAYPFVAKGQVFVPSAQPVVRAGEEVRLFVAGYNLAHGNVDVEGRVLGMDGKPMGEATVKALGRGVNQAGLEHLLAILKTGRLKPGDYVLEVSVIEPDPMGLSIALTKADRGRTISASAPFRVAARR